MPALSRRKWLRAAGYSAAGFSLSSRLALFAEEPHITLSPLNKLSDEDEIALGRRFAAQLEKEEAVITNPVPGLYLDNLVKKLASESQRPNLPYSAKLVNSHVPNACSLPGGFLFVNRGLIEMVRTEDELAATLAHEIGHVVGRHVVNQLLLSFTARALLKPVLDNLHKANGVIENIILKFGGAVAMLAMLHFSREDEAEADLLGFYEMLRAGWDPHGFIKLFNHLEELEKSAGRGGNPFLSDHPPTPEREAAIHRELREVKIPPDAETDSLKFQVFKSAMAVLPAPPKPAPKGQH